MTSVHNQKNLPKSRESGAKLANRRDHNKLTRRALRPHSRDTHSLPYGYSNMILRHPPLAERRRPKHNKESEALARLQLSLKETWQVLWLWRTRPCNKSPYPLMYRKGIFTMLYSGFPIEEAVSPHAGNLISASPSGCPHWNILHPLKFCWIIGFPGLYRWRRGETRFWRKMWDAFKSGAKKHSSWYRKSFWGPCALLRMPWVIGWRLFYTQEHYLRSVRVRNGY